MSLEDVSLVELTIWDHQYEGLEDDAFRDEIRAEIRRRGGPADPAAVRESIQRRDAERAAGADKRGPDAIWSRTMVCGCGDETQQLRHGYTREGMLWKGHVCRCDGWQCVDCGRLLDRSGDCCR